MREIDVRVQSGHAKAPPTGVFVAYLTNERGQRICFPRRRLRAKLAKEEYATTWQEED